MHKNDLIISLVEELWPDEYDLAGPNNLKDIISGDVEFEDVVGGSNIDLESALTVLVTIVTGIKTTIDIYDRLKTRLQRKPTVDEVIEEQHVDASIGKEINHQQRKLIIEAVIKDDEPPSAK